MAIFKKFAYGASVAALAALAPVAAVHAQQTSAALRGTIVNEAGSAVEAARVTVIHVPTASTASASTSENGTFSLSNLRVGGPYRLIVQRDGSEPLVIEGLSLQAGQQDPLRLTLASSDAASGDVIVVRGQRIDGVALTNGIGSAFNSEDLRNQPTLNRDFTDILARDPLVRSDGSGELSIAGISPSLNSLTIDGVENGEQFGINSDGIFPTQRPPIDIDAIESVSVAVTDFTVLNNGFQGGLINVTTKAGTNEFDGVLGFYYADENYAGDRAFERDVSTSNFSEEEFSLNVGGPIIEDKLFFFVSYSDFTRSSPTNFNFGDTDPEIFNIVRNLTQSVYNYDPGSKEGASNDSTTERLRLRFDWNINEDHRATFSYGSTEEAQRGSYGTFDFPTASRIESLENTTYTGELFSSWTDNFSTLFRVGYKESDFGRTPVGQAGGTAGSNFSSFTIEDIEPNDPYFAANGLDGNALIGTNAIDLRLGPDQFDQANAIQDELFTLYGQADYVFGDHTFTAGFNFERYEVTNVFVPASAGVVRFNGLQDYANRRARPSRGAGYLLELPPSGNIEDGITFFEYDQLSLFAQDSWAVTPELEVTVGVRFETYLDSNDTPERYGLTDLNGVERSFASVYGVTGTDTIKGANVFLPRIGFNWQPYDRLTVRGGYGAYSGGEEQVAFSNQYVPPAFAAEITDLQNVDGTTPPQDALNQLAAGNGNSVATFGVLDPNWEIPVQHRLALGVDYNLNLERFGFGDGYELTAQIVKSQTENGLFWRNLGWERDDVPAVGYAPDGRPIYPHLDELGLESVIMLSNGDKGEATFITLQAAKRYENGFSFDVSYTNSDVEEMNPLTSERAVSQFRGQVGPDRNNPTAARSVNETEHSFNVYFEYERDFFRDLTTSIGLFGRFESGEPFNYGMETRNTLFGEAASNAFPYGNNDPLYVPEMNVGGTAFVDQRVTFANAAAEADLLEFVQARNLQRFAGSIVPIGADTGPWTQRWDLSIEQELPGIWGADRWVGDNNFKITLDIQNVGNLINDDWGQRLNGPRFNGATVVRARLIDDATGAPIGAGLNDPICGISTTCTYEYQSVRTASDGSDIVSENLGASVWNARIGIRYEF